MHYTLLKVLCTTLYLRYYATLYLRYYAKSPVAETTGLFVDYAVKIRRIEYKGGYL